MNIVYGIGSAFSIVSDVIMVCSYLIFWKSRMLTSKKDALMMDTAFWFINIFAYLLTGAYDNMINSIFNIYRNHTGEKMRGQITELKMRSFLILSVVCMVLLTFGCFLVDRDLRIGVVMIITGIINLFGVVAATGMKGILKCNIAGTLLHIGLLLFLKSDMSMNVSNRLFVMDFITLIVCFIGLSKNRENDTDL